MEFENTPREMAEKLLEFIRDFSDTESETEKELNSITELFSELQASEKYNSLCHHLDIMFMDSIFD